MSNFRNILLGLLSEGVEKLDDPENELRLYIDNNSNLYKQQYIPIVKNYKKKIENGSFDKQAAIKGMRNLVDNGAKEYAKEMYKNVEYAKELFPGKVRDAVSKELAVDVEERIKNGEYDNLK